MAGIADLSIEVAVLRARMDAMEDAVTLARAQMNDRLEGMNRLREQIENERAERVSRTEWSSAHESLTAKIDAGFHGTEERLRTVENTLHGKLGPEFQEGVNERFLAADKRSGMTEKMIWLAMGGLGVIWGLITVALHFVKGG